MGIFNFFKNKSFENKAVRPEIPEDIFVDNTEPTFLNNNDERNGNVYEVIFGTGFPIDTIYGFINKDFEQKGFDDAMINTESSYKESGKKLIINELKQLFEQVKLKYKGDLRELSIHIKNLETQGLPLQAAQLKVRQDTFLEHLEKIQEMENSLNNYEEQVTRMVVTYERGFLKGLAAKSDLILNNYGKNE